MPLPHLLGPAQPLSSRKRSYAEITRSESRSLSPLPSKRRRRTSSSPTLDPNPYSSPSPSRPAPRRFTGDGLDYRRPNMAAATNDTNTIDLTLDDDTPPPISRRVSQSPDFYLSDSPAPSSTQAFAGSEQLRAPPFRAGNSAGILEVIDLSDEDDDHEPRLRIQPRVSPVRSPSLDIEFVRERPAQAALRRPDLPPPTPAASRREPWHPPQPVTGNLQQRFLNFARENAQHMFGNLNFPFILQPQMAAPPNQGGDGPFEIVDGDGFGDINFNYQQAAFQVGGRESETPQATHSPYKAPPAPRDGYLRSYEEESILICPCCKNELATGGKDEDDPKRGVWIIKACGHVYCGECASSRTIHKQVNSRDRRRSTRKPEPSPFKQCAVEDCKKPVTSKQSMIQVYL